MDSNLKGLEPLCILISSSLSIVKIKGWWSEYATPCQTVALGYRWHHSEFPIHLSRCSLIKPSPPLLLFQVNLGLEQPRSHKSQSKNMVLKSSNCLFALSRPPLFLQRKRISLKSPTTIQGVLVVGLIEHRRFLKSFLPLISGSLYTP